MSPPQEKPVASRSRYRLRGIEFPGPAVEAKAADDVCAPRFREGKIDDRTEIERVYVRVAARGRRQLQRRSAQGKIVELKVEAQSEVLVEIASDSRRAHHPAAAHISLRRSTGDAGSRPHVVHPIFIEL